MNKYFGLSMLLLAGTAFGKPYALNQNFTDRCSTVPHPVSHVAIPGGVTCVTHHDGTVYVTTSNNGGAGAMALAWELCKAVPGVDLASVAYSCKNNQ